MALHLDISGNGTGGTNMGRRHKCAAHVTAASLLCLVALASAAAAQIGLIKTTGEILSGQSTSDSSSTTIVSQGQKFLEPAQTSATLIVGFNVNADAGPAQVAPEIGIASFDLRFTLDHAASFDLTLDFLLRGQLLRLPDEDCQGSIALGDISFPSLVRLRDGAEFPLGVVLPGASLDFDAGMATFNFAEQDSRTIQVRGDPVETTAYRLTFSAFVTAISQSCEVSARFGADNGSTTDCSACVYPGFGDRVRDDDGLFVTVTVSSLCGNPTLDAGEECDFGAANGAEGSCCDAFCRLAPATKICRPAAGDCDQSETCSGLSGDCPADLPQPAGASCTADRSLCTDDVCNDGVCTHPLRAGATCGGNECICDADGLFCTGPVRCPVGGGLCIQDPPPCGEDDTCDEEHDVCVSPFGTVTATATSSPTATSVTPGAPTPTATSSPTATGVTPTVPTPTATASVTATSAPGAMTPSATPTAMATTCVGDCNGDRMVAINELILGVNVALNSQPVTACAAFDGDRDGSVAINELVTGVRNALAGCPI